MEPSNDHERLIAKAIDTKLREDPHHTAIAWDIAMSLDFPLSASDTQFLIRYVKWRLTHRVSP